MDGGTEPATALVGQEERALDVAWALAGRRDSLLLMLLALGALGWSWERGSLVLLGGSLVAAVAYTMGLRLRHPGPGPAHARSHGLGGWLNSSLALCGAATALMVARAALQGLGSLSLTVLLALLVVGWEVWLYFWTALPSTPQEEEQDGRVE